MPASTPKNNSHIDFTKAQRELNQWDALWKAVTDTAQATHSGTWFALDSDMNPKMTEQFVSLFNSAVAEDREQPRHFEIRIPEGPANDIASMLGHTFVELRINDSDVICYAILFNYTVCTCVSAPALLVNTARGQTALKSARDLVFRTKDAATEETSAALTEAQDALDVLAEAAASPRCWTAKPIRADQVFGVWQSYRHMEADRETER